MSMVTVGRDNKGQAESGPQLCSLTTSSFLDFGGPETVSGQPENERYREGPGAAKDKGRGRLCAQAAVRAWTGLRVGGRP